MTHLRIEQNNIPEVIGASVIHKLYEIALSIPEPNSGEEDVAYLSGNLQLTHSYKYECDYLTDRFTNLHITTTGDYYIRFRDAEVQKICSNTWGDGVGCLVSNVENVKIRGKVAGGNVYFYNNPNIINLDLSAFKNIEQVQLWGSTNIKNIYIGKINDFSLNTVAGMIWNTSITIDKTIIGELCNWLGGESITSGTTTFGIFGIKKLSKDITLHGYCFRRCVVNNFYIGDPNHYFDLSQNMSTAGGIGTLYVHTNQLAYYQNLVQQNSWLAQSVQSYDFDTDPDGIFDELQVLY